MGPSVIVDRILTREFTIGVVGLGYVGVPLVIAALNQGFCVVGFDISSSRVDKLNNGETGFKHLSNVALLKALSEERFRATAQMDGLSEVDAIIIAVPTPLSKQQQPDLAFVIDTAQAIARTLRPGHLVVLESTTWPGTTRELVEPILESSGLRRGSDYFLAFSPEREDPGNRNFETRTIPKVVGADDPASAEIACQLYSQFVDRVVPVSSTAVAEASKLTENIYRSVNIALVNELKVVFDRMGIDVWEVIEAAKTKPFGYTAFAPGPGLGGHCIPIDPYYLAWKAREFGIATRFIELAGEINTAMPLFVASKLTSILSERARKCINGSNILLLGMAYKKNIEDIRESPSLRLIEILERGGAAVSFHDPFVSEIPETREFASLRGRKSVPADMETLEKFDAVVIVTDHDNIDYEIIVKGSRIVVDCRNVCERQGLSGENIYKA
jgi:UDP-N-acetyl-D-glucosamine dehydrogenase